MSQETTRKEMVSLIGEMLVRVLLVLVGLVGTALGFFTGMAYLDEPVYIGGFWEWLLFAVLLFTGLFGLLWLIVALGMRWIFRRWPFLGKTMLYGLPVWVLVISFPLTFITGTGHRTSPGEEVFAFISFIIPGVLLLWLAYLGDRAGARYSPRKAKGVW